MRPKLRTLIIDVYKDVSYTLDDDSYSTAEYQDVVRKRFIKAWESLADGYKVCSPVAGKCYFGNVSTGYLHGRQLPPHFRLGTGCFTSPLGKVHYGSQIFRSKSTLPG